MRGIQIITLGFMVTAIVAGAQTLPAPENPATQSTATAPLFDRAAALRRRIKPNHVLALNDNWFPYGGPPARFARIGYALNTPFPESDTTLAATPVTLHLSDVPFDQAIAALGQQGGSAIRWDTSSYLVAHPNVTMETNAQPFLECLLELATSTGTMVNNISSNQVLLTNNWAGRSVGVWCTSGAFAFVLQRIVHHVPLDSGHPIFQMTLSYLVEPKVTVIASPNKLESIMIKDELGHIIATEPVAREWPQGLPPNFYTGYERTFLVHLMDRPDSGKRIALFQANAPFTLITRTQEISVDHPLTAEATSTLLCGIRTTIAKMTIGPNEYSTTITFKRESFPVDDWAKIIPVLQATRPRVRDAQGRLLQDWGNPGAASDDQVCVQCAFPHMGGSGDLPPDSLKIVVPLEIKTVAVPIEFKDILLP